MAGKSLYFYLDFVNLIYIPLAIAVAVYANRLFQSLPIGLWGDIAVSFVGIAAFAIFLRQGWGDLLLEFNDYAPALFSFAYMPFVAFVAIGFVRTLVPLFPARAAQPAMAMAGPPPMGNSGTPAAPPVSSAPVQGAPSPAPESNLTKWLKRLVGAAVLILFALIALGKYVTRNELPGCDAQQTKELLATIFSRQNLKAKRYDTLKTVSTSENLVTCAGTVTWGDDAQADLEYSIEREEGAKFQVRITRARDK
jgi:hypothetical protein